MREKSTESVATSSPTWETLEVFARQSMQQLLQRMLEEEVDGVLGLQDSRSFCSDFFPWSTPSIITAASAF